MTDSLGRYARITVWAALFIFTVKLSASYLTGSVGLFSDAMESVVNLVSSGLLVVVLRIAKQPPDPDHPYGHDKAEYFANGAQGALILLAAFGIAAAAVNRFFHPQELQEGPLGLTLALTAALCNLILARVLQKHGRRLRSEALKGEAAHLMADVWTSAAVILGVALVYLTGHHWLDPAAAVAISFWIVYTGARLIHTSVQGLMDSSLPPESQEAIVSVLERHKAEAGIDYHALRTRVAGARIFVSVHILVPGVWSVKKGHQLMHEIEEDVCRRLEGVSFFTHLEPLEEQCSFDDIEIE